jgi:hypothetical protein
MVGNQLVLFVMPALAIYAGFEAWPLYLIVVIGAASGAWNLLYFGTTPLKIASGGPFAYLFRIAIFNSILAAIFYAAGVGIARLVGH